MKVQPKERFKLAWRWLPLELLIMLLSIGIGWGLNQWLPKPVYQAQVDLKIVQKPRAKMTASQRRRQRRQDIKLLPQFSVMPHQGIVLTQDSAYAYMHAGIWQPIQELSESVQATPVEHQPVLRVTASSSSRSVARLNARAFEVAITDNLKSLKHYRITTVRRRVQRTPNVIRGAIWKLVLVIGGSLAVLSPYLVKFVQGWGRQDEAT